MKNVIHNYWLRYENKTKNLFKNYFNLKDFSDWKYTIPGLSINGYFEGIYEAIKDGILLGDLTISSFNKLHNEIGKKVEVHNSEFFTPDKIAKELAEKINKININNDYVLEIGTGFGSVLQYINNGIGIELNEIYVKICNEFLGLKVVQKDITKDKLKTKAKFVCANPPFGTDINKYLFSFIKENTTDDMHGFLLLPNNYDNLLTDYGFNIINKEDVKGKFTNTNIKTSIYEFSKK